MEIKKDIIFTPMNRSNSITPDQRANEWRSCCFTSDRRCVKFLAQLSITLLMMIFSMYKIIESDECSSDKQVFSSILTMCLSIWLPAPTISKKD